MEYKYTSLEWAKSVLPKRQRDGNKGSFGKLFMYVGSDTYMGAALLSVEAALRGGAGYVIAAASGELKRALLSKFPEVIYKDFGEASTLTESELEALISEQRGATAALVGCGCSKSNKLFDLVKRLLTEGSGTLILDADAINSMAESREEAKAALKNSQRQVILTPHPLEFSRLTGIPVSLVNEARIECARTYAEEVGCTVLLKGNETVITDGKEVYINTSGSSALAKAGSGDALAGLLASIAALSSLCPLELSALAAYVHGRAGDKLEKELSSYGVTPSDLPKEMAKILCEIENVYG